MYRPGDGAALHMAASENHGVSHQAVPKHQPWRLVHPSLDLVVVGHEEKRVWEKGLYLHTKHQLVVMCGQVQEALFSNVPGISVDVKLILQESLLTSWTPRTRTRQAHWRRSSLWPCPSATPRVGCCTQPGDLPPSLEFSHVDLPLNWTLVQWATHHISQTVDTVSLVEGIRWSRVTDLFIVNKVKAMHLKWSQMKYEKTVVMNLPDRSCLRCSRLVWPTGCRSLGVRLVPQFAPAEILKQIFIRSQHNCTCLALSVYSQVKCIGGTPKQIPTIL